MSSRPLTIADFTFPGGNPDDFVWDRGAREPHARDCPQRPHTGKYWCPCGFRREYPPRPTISSHATAEDLDAGDDEVHDDHGAHTLAPRNSSPIQPVTAEEDADAEEIDSVSDITSETSTRSSMSAAQTLFGGQDDDDDSTKKDPNLDTIDEDEEVRRVHDILAGDYFAFEQLDDSTGWNDVLRDELLKTAAYNNKISPPDATVIVLPYEYRVDISSDSEDSTVFEFLDVGQVSAAHNNEKVPANLLAFPPQDTLTKDANNAFQLIAPPSLEDYENDRLRFLEAVQKYYSDHGLDPTDPSTIVTPRKNLPRRPPGLQLGCTGCRRSEAELGHNLTLMCAACLLGDPFLRYCSKKCQLDDWPRHRKVCGIVIDTETNMPLQLMPARIQTYHWVRARQGLHNISDIFKTMQETLLPTYLLVIDAYRALEEVTGEITKPARGVFHVWQHGYGFEGLKTFLDRTVLPSNTQYMPHWWSTDDVNRCKSLATILYQWDDLHMFPAVPREVYTYSRYGGGMVALALREVAARIHGNLDEETQYLLKCMSAWDVLLERGERPWEYRVQDA